MTGLSYRFPSSKINAKPLIPRYMREDPLVRCPILKHNNFGSALNIPLPLKRVADFLKTKAEQLRQRHSLRSLLIILFGKKSKNLLLPDLKPGKDFYTIEIIGIKVVYCKHDYPTDHHNYCNSIVRVFAFTNLHYFDNKQARQST